MIGVLRNTKETGSLNWNMGNKELDEVRHYFS